MRSEIHFTIFIFEIRFNIIVLCTSLPLKWSFYFRFLRPTSFKHGCIIFPMRTTYSAHRIFLDLITLSVVDEEYIL
jgi:hypothetical protein